MTDNSPTLTCDFHTLLRYISPWRTTAIGVLILIAFVPLWQGGCAPAATQSDQIRQPIATTQDNPVPNTPLEHIEIKRFPTIAVAQKGDYWCWAACAEMVMKYYGVQIAQEEIVANTKLREVREQLHHQHIDADSRALAASQRELLGVLAPEWEQRIKEQTAQMVALRGQTININLGTMLSNATIKQVDYDLAVVELYQQNPLIMGVRSIDGHGGHVYAVFGVTFRTIPVPPHSLENVLRDSLETRPNFSIESFDVINPDSGTTETLSFKDLASRVDFITSRQLAAAALQREYSEITVTNDRR